MAISLGSVEGEKQAGRQRGQIGQAIEARVVGQRGVQQMQHVPLSLS
jgi:hypothetical protein